MIGGKVIGVVRSKDNTLLHVQGTGGESRDCLSVRCIERRKDNGSHVAVGIGDSVWWQGDSVLWTPSVSARCGVDFDIHLPKVGYSH